MPHVFEKCLQVSALPNASTSNLQLTRSCHLSRPGSESRAGVRACQAAAHGKYFSFYDVTRPDAVPTFRLAPADPASQILLYYQNTGGINMSIADYQLACNDADIYAFTETWLNNNTLSHQLFNETSSVHRQDRSVHNSNKSSGGGVLLAVRSSFKSRLLKPPEDLTVEHLWVAISMLTGTLFVCVIYVPPDRVNDCTLIENHTLSLEWVVSQMGATDNIVILGDFNLSTISWLHGSNNFRFPDNSRSSIRPASSVLLDAYSSARLRQVNGTMNANNRLLDLCFISEELGHSCSLLQAPAPLVKNCRHHPPLLMTFELLPEHHFEAIAETVHYDFYSTDFEGMKNFLADVDWTTSLSGDDANSAASTMSNILIYAIDRFVPKKLTREQPHPSWSNSELRRLKRLKRAALKKYSKRRTDLSKAEYLRANTAYKRLNSALYNDYQFNLQNRLKTNPKKFWSYV
ncbi:uncharacterized protein LOC129717219 [Wyeomyia smithii]|uniref:uncharacterized protein LOC129717219 n=1 Tax=Wyeomyia smithii TaxID=174621 RepID=UPI002467C6D2|nr:uncharacterized protein LOC129717219 [Wyeomyia smithii]